MCSQSSCSAGCSVSPLSSDCPTHKHSTTFSNPIIHKYLDPLDSSTRQTRPARASECHVHASLSASTHQYPGALGWDVLVVGLLAELVCVVDLRKEVVVRRIAAAFPGSRDGECVHGQKAGMRRSTSEDKIRLERVKSRKGGAAGEGPRCASEVDKSRISQAEVTTVKVKDEWLNMLFATFWQTYGPWISQYVAAQLEYWITDLGLEVEFCSVGTVPLAIKSTRGYPQAKFSRHEGRGDSEFHSDPELTFDLDLEIELISDLRIKLSYQVTRSLSPKSRWPAPRAPNLVHSFFRVQATAVAPPLTTSWAF